MNTSRICLYDYGADGSGSTDCSDAFARGIEAAAKAGKPLWIPQGFFKVSRTIRLPSGISLEADPNARIFLEGQRKKRRGEFLLANADPDTGNQGISVRGGIWDGNNQGPGNAKPDIFDPEGYSGAVMNFCGVSGLTLSDLTVANSVTYNIRMARLQDFTIENIGFLSDVPGHNQDGLHFNGCVRRGKVRNIRALSRGQTNDDLIALNADDCMERVENFGMVRGEISQIDFENIFAQDCHTLLRLLSVTAPIRQISLRNLFGGFRCYAINADGARYCRTPLFQEEEYPNGCGAIQDVTIENMICRPTAETAGPALCLETLAQGLKLRDFRLICDSAMTVPALMARNLANTRLVSDRGEYRLTRKEDCLTLDSFSALEMTRLP